MDDSIRSLFLLDKRITYLNHGSFGACPRPVFEAYQTWQRKLEEQPVKFLARDIYENLAEARQALAKYLNCSPLELVYFTNPTTAANMVARSLSLKPGDEILTTNHEYSSMDRLWRFITQKTGAQYIRLPIPLPVSTHEAFVQTFWAGVSERTRVIFMSHITSETALIFRVEEICRRARELGILTVIDGAHAPGQIPLDLQKLGADIYFGACHKWMMAPKGAGFLYAEKGVQAQLSPLVVSWGFGEPIYDTGNVFINHHEWQGTRDIAAFLSVPAAIRFQQANSWSKVRDRCRVLAAETRARIHSLTNLPPICPNSPTWFRQFFAARLPEVDVHCLKEKLYHEFRIEVPIYRRGAHPFIRVSFQGYNSREDADALIAALREFFG